MPNKLHVTHGTLNLTNLFKSDTCYNNNHKSTTDLSLTDKPILFNSLV